MRMEMMKMTDLRVTFGFSTAISLGFKNTWKDLRLKRSVNPISKEIF